MDGRARVTQGNAVRLPFRDASFDLVYSFGVLLLVEELDAAVAEIHRVLKPGGTVITMFYNRQSLHYYLKTLYYYGIVCDLEDLLGPSQPDRLVHRRIRLSAYLSSDAGQPAAGLRSLHHRAPRGAKPHRGAGAAVPVRRLPPGVLVLGGEPFGFLSHVSGAQVTPGVFTWSELPPISGNVLVVINSADHDTETVEALLATMRAAPAIGNPARHRHTGVETMARRARHRCRARPDRD